MLKIPTAPHRLKSIVPLAALVLASCSPSANTQVSGATQPAWPTQQQAGSLHGPTDPVASRLTVWLNLVGNAHAPAKEYADFLSTRPVWPRWQLLKLRMQQALAQENDPTVLQQVCGGQTLTYGPALARCKAALPQDAARFSAQARQAWMNGNDTTQAAIALSTSFPEVLTPEASWLRFNREEKSGLLAAAKQTATFLKGSRQQLARARLALRGNDPTAEVLLSTLNATDAADPILQLDHARWLRNAQRYDDAVQLWKGAAGTAEAQSALPLFWRERDALARELLQNNRDADAFWVANDTTASGANKLDAAFLSGWIAQEKLQDATKAEPFFRQLASSSALITRSRGYYWLGRTHALSGNQAAAKADYQQAATDVGTFYGQMAAAHLEGQGATLLNSDTVPALVKQRLKTLRDNSLNTATEVRLDGSDLAQAAQILVSWGDTAHARDFLALLAQQVVTMPDKLALVRLADSLHVPDIGVTLARQVGKSGVFLLHEGWPMPYTIPDTVLPSGLVLGLMRQESSFNPDAVSSSNAIGLMQLKPDTAGDMARKIGLPSSAATAAGLHDPNNNMQLGIAYLQHMQERFGRVVPYIAAAYNGGPTRLARWLNSTGNPAAQNATQEQMIDWIESIPYSETRNYVQRVWENMTIYTVLGQN